MDITLKHTQNRVHIHLNRPKALNALTYEMIEAIDRALADHRAESFLFTGEGKAFCAGGDIKQASATAQEEPVKADAYFQLEYGMNRNLYHEPRQTMALMDGITMGGGVGVSAPCEIRICTENTRWAMPETTIGFFPDIGGAYYLSRMPGQLGLYLGLTGAHVTQPVELLKYGIATHFLPSSKIQEFVQAYESGNSIMDMLSLCEAPPMAGPSHTLPSSKTLRRYFKHDTLSQIFEALKDEGGDGVEVAQAILASLEAKSPTALAITFEHIKRAELENFDTVIARDLKLAHWFMRFSDFHEGVRALLIDKDNAPKWSPCISSSNVNLLFTDDVYP